MFIGLFTEDGLDQIVETDTQKNKEKRDLMAMGCKVNCYKTNNESDLHAIDDWIHDGRSFAVARNRVESGQYI